MVENQFVVLCVATPYIQEGRNDDDDDDEIPHFTVRLKLEN